MNDDKLKRLVQLAEKKLTADTAEVVEMWRLLKDLANEMLLNAGFSEKSVRTMHTKFNDAGRRSAPWKAFSSVVPGRPQDGQTVIEDYAGYSTKPISNTPQKKMQLWCKFDTTSKLYQ